MLAFRESLRSLRHSPAFAATAIAMLAVGIAVNTITVTLLNNLAFRLIPAADADRLVRIYPLDEQGRRLTLVSHPDYRELRGRSSTLSDLAAYMPTTVTVRTAVIPGKPPTELVEPREMFAYAVSANYFSVLGVQAARGRLFLAAEDRTPDTDAVAIIGHRLWERLGASDAAMTTPLIVNGRAFSIIGVLPKTFVGTEPLAVDLWVPTAMQARVIPDRGPPSRADERWLILLGRLRPGATRTTAERELSPLLHHLTRSRAPAERANGVTVRRATFFPIDRDPAGVAVVWVLATVLLLVAACANVVNLVLARAVTRRREIAVRLALGASLGTLVRQSLAESAWLAALAGALALALSSWTLSAIYQLALPRLPFEWSAIIFDVDPDWTVFLATSALCGLAAALVGLAPALQARRVDVTDALRGSRSIAGRRMTLSRARGLLVTAQVAISVALIIAAGLLASAADRAEALDLGFSTDGVLLTSYDLKRHQYPDARVAAFNRVLIERARQIPGVVSASLGSHVALTGGMRLTRIWSPEAGGADSGISARYVFAAGSYFDTLGIHLARGRDFPEGDRAMGVAEAVVSEILAERLWPGRHPIGRHITTDLSNRE
jgi:predicted permease